MIKLIEKYERKTNPKKIKRYFLTKLISGGD